MGKRKLITLLLTIGIFVVNFSFGETRTDTVGVLVLAHGGGNAWDQAVQEATKSLEKSYLVEVAFGMADPVTMQTGIDNLEKKGAKTIVVVPLFISSYSMIIRQNEYLLGLRDTLADPPMIMSHGGGHQMAMSGMSGGHASMGGNHVSMGSSHASMGHGGDAATTKDIKQILPQLKIHARIILTSALDDNPLVAQIIYDRISELSTNPSNETVLIVAHGPNDEEDNKKWLTTIDHIADQVRAMEAQKGNKFKQIFTATVRDDAKADIYEQAKENLRNLVYQAGKDGDVLVIPLLLSGGGVEGGFAKRLDGLRYKWNGKALLPDPRISEFMESSVKEALAKN